MRALVIGASGQIGGHLLTRLRSQGHAVSGTYASSPQPGLSKLDIQDEAAVRAAMADVAPDVVFLPAGWTWVDGNEDDPAKAARLNRDEPLAVACAARDAGALFVTWSTDYVFDGTDGPNAEDDPPHPLNVYGRAKLEGEVAIRAAVPEHLILRTTTVYGPEAQGKNFVYQVLRRVSKGERMVAPDDQLATPSYGPDVADAALELVSQGARGTWHVAGPELLDRAAFARLACEVWGKEPSLIDGKPTSTMTQKAVRPLRGGLRIDKLLAAGITMRGPRAGLVAMKAALAVGHGAAI
jgi:dTDP-4-dehydrorhamnose reductase